MQAGAFFDAYRWDPLTRAVLLEAVGPKLTKGAGLFRIIRTRKGRYRVMVFMGFLKDQPHYQRLLGDFPSQPAAQEALARAKLSTRVALRLQGVLSK